VAASDPVFRRSKLRLHLLTQDLLPRSPSLASSLELTYIPRRIAKKVSLTLSHWLDWREWRRGIDEASVLSRVCFLCFASLNVRVLSALLDADWNAFL
jgi:hypothetical protein